MLVYRPLFAISIEPDVTVLQFDCANKGGGIILYPFYQRAGDTLGGADDGQWLYSTNGNRYGNLSR